MSFLFGDSSDADEGEMGNVFGDGGRKDSVLDKKTSDGEGEFFSTFAFGGTPTKKDPRPTISQGHGDSGSSGGAGGGSAPPAPGSVTGRVKEDPFLVPSPFPPPEKKRNYGASPTKAQSQQRDMKEASITPESKYREASIPRESKYREASIPPESKYREASIPPESKYREASIPPESKYREATLGDARSRETPRTVASGRTSSQVPTGSSSVLRELLVMQQKQVAALLPELEEAEGRDRELEAALELVARDSRAYRQQLGALREQYSARLSQVTGFLQGP